MMSFDPMSSLSAVDTFTNPSAEGQCVSHNERWYVARVAPNMSMMTGGGLRRLGHRFLEFSYLEPPKPRKKPVERPWFPGYAFVRFDLAEPLWPLILDVPGVFYLLGSSPSRPIGLSDDELVRVAVHLATISNAPPLPSTRVLQMMGGQTVRVARGPFTGFCGAFIDRKGDEIRVNLDIFGRKTPVTLALGAVEPA
jgi:transcription antitermination factor NusG